MRHCTGIMRCSWTGVSTAKTMCLMQPGSVGLACTRCAHAAVACAQQVMGMPAPFHAQASQQISQTSTEDEQAEAEERCAAPQVSS